MAKKTRWVDDTCIWANGIRESFLDTCKLLDTAAKNGVTFSPAKFQFCPDEVDFAGLHITTDGIMPY